MPDLVESIRRWAGSLPGWQREALRRLYHQRSLSRDDDDALYALLKGLRGIHGDDIPVVEDWTATDTAARGSNSSPALIKISRVHHVNALANDQELAFLPTGLTAIYGDNGAGKSGYARLFKRACKARDAGEPILPNVNASATPKARASAVFVVADGGNEQTVTWEDGQAPAPELQHLVVFDARSAQHYISVAATSTYMPDGMDLLLGLVNACDRLRARLNQEIQQATVERSAFAALSARSTRVGKLLAGLTWSTPATDIEALAQLDEAETKELATLSEAMKEANPKEKARALRLQTQRWKELASRCRERSASLSDAAVANLRRLVDASVEAKKVATVAAEQFRSSPGFLPGTGDDAWKDLFQAARLFATHAHPGKSIEALEGSDQCPLCQQPLAEGAQRLASFDAFVQREAEKQYTEKRAEAAAAYTAFKALQLDVGFDTALGDELREIQPSLCAQLEVLPATLRARHASIVAACKPDADWAAIDALPEDVTGPLEAHAAELLQQCEALEDLVDESRAQASKDRHAELSDRAALAQVKGAVLQAIRSLHMQHRLSRCEPDVLTHAITQQTGVLNQQILTPQLASALNAELDALGVGNLRVELTSKNVKGTTQYGLMLRRESACDAARVLSEGEHRAIAIGAFLADLALSGSSAGVVFDDPVSSLDHERRPRVARRLVQEAKSRQVIVLSHDLAFMRLLQGEAKIEGVPMRVQSLKREGTTSGIVDENLPVAGMNIKQRLAALNRACDRVAQLRNQQLTVEADAVLRGAWVDLRWAWERAVEEVLFNDVVQRFDKGVSTLSLEAVDFGDEEVRGVFRGMDRCNTTPHDAATQMHVPAPSLDELRSEVATLKTWVSDVRNRGEAAKKRRGFR
jgi:energy-coupling factor transporter ATP-binding protein EcfA2